jgi:hypothetical protein
MLLVIAAHSLSVLTAVVPCQIQLSTQYTGNYIAVHSTAIHQLGSCNKHTVTILAHYIFACRFDLMICHRVHKTCGTGSQQYGQEWNILSFHFGKWYDACSPCFVHEKVGMNKNNTAITSIGLFRG